MEFLITEDAHAFGIEEKSLMPKEVYPKSD
jgi:hypothetical protein